MCVCGGGGGGGGGAWVQGRAAGRMQHTLLASCLALFLATAPPASAPLPVCADGRSWVGDARRVMAMSKTVVGMRLHAEACALTGVRVGRWVWCGGVLVGASGGVRRRRLPHLQALSPPFLVLVAPQLLPAFSHLTPTHPPARSLNSIHPPTHPTHPVGSIRPWTRCRTTSMCWLRWRAGRRRTWCSRRSWVGG